MYALKQAFVHGPRGLITRLTAPDPVPLADFFAGYYEMLATYSAAIPAVHEWVEENARYVHAIYPGLR